MKNQLVYIVSFNPNNTALNAVYGGVWSIHTTFDNARTAAEGLIELYQEKLIDAHEQSNGLYVYLTDKGKYTIEPMIVDD